MQPRRCEQVALSFRAPGDVALAPSHARVRVRARTRAWFFFVMPALFLIQTIVAAAFQHYRAELADFFGTAAAADLFGSQRRVGHHHRRFER